VRASKGSLKLQTTKELVVARYSSCAFILLSPKMERRNIRFPATSVR